MSWDQDHDPCLGLKHFCSQSLNIKENPASQGLRSPGRPQPESSTVARSLLRFF